MIFIMQSVSAFQRLCNLMPACFLDKIQPNTTILHLILLRMHVTFHVNFIFESLRRAHYLFFSKIHVSLFCHIIFSKTLPKAQRTRGFSSAYQSNLSCHITSSNTNRDQISPSKYRPRINFKISTTHQHLD